MHEDYHEARGTIRLLGSRSAKESIEKENRVELWPNFFRGEPRHKIRLEISLELLR